MPIKKLFVDNTNRELSRHGTETFPMTVSHDDLWDFEGKRVPIHWHSDLEISLPREGEALYQIYQHTYILHPGEGILLNQNVPHSCHAVGNRPARYSTFLVRPDFLYGTWGSDIERLCFRPFLENSAIPCILLSGKESWEADVFQKLNQTETLFDAKAFGFQLGIKGLLCEVFGQILSAHQKDLASFLPANPLELKRFEQMLSYLHAHFDVPLSLQELSKDVHLSRESCCRLFKKMTGKTISAYLEEYRIHKSLSFVQSGQYSMIQIAEMTGFSNASRFAGAFRKQFGCSPREYRDSLLASARPL